MPEKFRDLISENLRNKRMLLALKQDEFAELFNKTEPQALQTSRSDVCKYETGKSLCPADKYLKFLELKK